MRNKPRFILYGIILVLDLSILANLGTTGISRTGNLGVAIFTCLLVTAGALIVMFNYEQLRTPRQREQALLRRVGDSWIETLSHIERFVPGVAPIELTKTWQPDEVNSPHRQLAAAHNLERISKPELRPNPTIVQAYKQSGRSLLILGGAGSGKTLALLTLARTLLRHALRDSSQPLPVVFNLSTWKERQPLEQWLTAELSSRYDVSPKIGNAWLLEKRLVLLLDGLDEVTTDPSGCVRAINDFLKEIGAPGIVVSSRYPEHEKQNSKLELHQAIKLEALSSHGVDEYVTGAGPGSVTAAASLESVSFLRDLASTPLMLNLILLVDEELMNRDEGQPCDVESCRSFLLKSYIDSQLGRGKKMGYSYERNQVISWLEWLAGKMRDNSQNVMLVEHLQPSWLPPTWKDQWPYIFLSRFLGATAVIGLGVGIMYLSKAVGVLVAGQEGSPIPSKFKLIGVEDKLWEWLLITCVFGGLTIAFVDLMRFRKAMYTEDAKAFHARHDIEHILTNLISCTVIFFLSTYLLSFDRYSMIFGSLIYGVAFAFTFWFRGRGRTLSGDINTADKLVFSGSGTRIINGLGWGILAGALSAGLIGLPVAIISGAKLALQLGLIICLLGLVIGGMVGALTKVSVLQRSSPNQGIFMSLRSTVLVLIAVGVISVGLMWLSAITMTGSAKETLEPAFFFGLVFGLLAGFSYGGLDVVYHYTLRLVLSLRGYAPLRYVPFLDYAVNLGFLRRVGGGYLFLHHILLEHFATSPLKPKSMKAGEASR